MKKENYFIDLSVFVLFQISLKKKKERNSFIQLTEFERLVSGGVKERAQMVVLINHLHLI